ncbi:hypothetical protein F4810DRAFT_690669 [Camillea tinctor]|nr:hypothetical protein F4810DRAFT_690669 [Camillea tinctor]
MVIALACTASSELQVAGNLLTDGQLHKRYNQTVYSPLFASHSKTTPRFLNLTHQTENPLFKIGSAADDGDGTCAPGTPCSNGACCSKSGFCGYSPDFCGSDNCVSNSIWELWSLTSLHTII